MVLVGATRRTLLFGRRTLPETDLPQRPLVKMHGLVRDAVHRGVCFRPDTDLTQLTRGDEVA